jgi:type II secretory pathway pseudopilin PulG
MCDRFPQAIIPTNVYGCGSMWKHSITADLLPASTLRRSNVVGMRVQMGFAKPIHQQRSGLTLLEILLAATILATALAALGQHTSTGIQAAVRSELQTEAAAKCQSQLNRLLIGEVDIPSGGSMEQSFDDNSDWKWTATMRPFVNDSLSVLSVSVFREGPNRQLTTFQLSRIVDRSRMLSEERLR